MDDTDVLWLCLSVMGLSLLALLHGHLIGRTADRLAEVRADVEFLKDHSMTVETEARP